MSAYQTAYTTVEQGCEYTCGQCGVDMRLKSGEPIQCKECGYRCVSFVFVRIMMLRPASSMWCLIARARAAVCALSLPLAAHRSPPLAAVMAAV
jgi:DNA-directed RNA polymerase subunit RPC12/RpoP